MPVLSIVVPVYNGEKYLRRTIGNILSQSFQDFELLIINDGSQDYSLSILKEYANEDSRIRLFTKDNEGICATRNYGIQHAIGKYIIFLDQDDDFDSCLCEDYVSTIIHYDADMCVFGRKQTKIWSDGHSEEKVILPIPEVLINERDIYAHIYNVNNQKTFLTIWNCIYNLEIIKQKKIVFPIELKYGYEDTFFNMLFATHCKKIVLSERCHYSYQLRIGGSTISKKNSNVINDFVFISQSIKNLTNSEKYFNDYMFFLLRFIKVPYGRELSHNNYNFYEKKILVKQLCKYDFWKGLENCQFFKYDCPISYLGLWNMVKYSIVHKLYFLTVLCLDIIRKKS